MEPIRLSTPARPASAAPIAWRALLDREPGMEYWKVERVALYLDVGRKRVYQLVEEKRLSAVRLGPRQMRVSRASLDEYLASLHECEERALAAE